MPPEDLGNFKRIDRLFSKHCVVDAWVSPQLILEAETTLADYFQDKYSAAVKSHLAKKWESHMTENTDAANDIITQIKSLITPYLVPLVEGNPLPCVWAHAPFALLKENPTLSNQEKATLHKDLLKEISVFVLQLLTTKQSRSEAACRDLLAPGNNALLKKALQDSVVENLSTANNKTPENIQSLKNRMLYLFFKALFQVSYTELFHFEGFEYNKDLIHSDTAH